MTKALDLDYLDNLSDCIIQATINSGITKQQLADVFNDRGIVGIYHLGMKHMYEYLEVTDELY